MNADDWLQGFGLDESIDGSIAAWTATFLNRRGLSLVSLSAFICVHPRLNPLSPSSDHPA